MGDALLLVVQRAEKALERPLVLADSGFPSSKLLDGPHASIKSKFIASTGISEVSGDLKSLPTIIGPLAKPDTSYVYTHKARQLIAHVEKTPKYTQCLVTNAIDFFGPPPEKPKFNYKLLPSPPTLQPPNCNPSRTGLLLAPNYCFGLLEVRL